MASKTATQRPRRGRVDRARYRYDPSSHRETLGAIIAAIAERITAGAAAPLSNEVLHPILRRYPRDGSGFFSRAQIIAGFRAFGGDYAPQLASRTFLEHLQMRPVRTRSGVSPITVLTRPFPCPGRCVFCPNDVRMPKSYLSDEPGCQRAEDNGFDPYLQTYNRLLAYRAMGHTTDKVELLVLGGTWSFYPEAYQVWFIRRCYDAMNDLSAGRDGRALADAQRVSLKGLAGALDGRAVDVSYNRVLRRHLSTAGAIEPEGSQVDWEALAAAQRANEHGDCRCVGLVLETRPDYVSEAELRSLRKLGCTKVQVGLQSLDDTVLAANKRGHDVSQAAEALRMLRGAGFKLLVHWMPNLLGATPDSDIADFGRMFGDAAFRPDELKLYPCSLVESAELMQFHARGQWRPYDHPALLRVVRDAMAATPRYCRLSRVIRDISSHDIVEGNRLSNLRELAEAALRERGTPCQDIRAREVGHLPFDPDALRPAVTRYTTVETEELFLELALPDGRLAAFCRLSLPTAPRPLGEVRDSAIVRELHVYGSALPLGAAPGGGAQHRGLGRRLLAEAAAHAEAAGLADLAVISATGTRPYYRSRGFADGELYQHLSLPVERK